MKTCHEMAIDHDLKRMELIMLRLRTREGLDLKQYAKLGDEKELLKQAKDFIRSGHLRKRDGALIATEKGFLLLEMMTKRLL